MRNSLLIAGILILLVSPLAEAQNFYSRLRDRKLVLSIGSGLSSYYGELNPPRDYLDTRPNLDLGARYRLVNHFSVRLNAMWYQLAGDDAQAEEGSGRASRNLSFRSNNLEFSLSAFASLFPTNERFVNRRMVNPYAVLGIGLTYFNPKAQYKGSWYALRPLETEGVSYPPVALLVPAGIGINVKVAPFFNVALEGGYRKTFTDYLDDVSTHYPNPAELESNLARTLTDRSPEAGYPPNEPGDVRGNPGADDGYFILNLKVEYYFPYNKLAGMFRSKGRF